MKDQILSRFVARSPDPNNPAGVATYAYCGKTFELPMPSFVRAKELEQFMGHIVGNARRMQREAMTAQMRGATNTMLADTAVADADDPRTAEEICAGIVKRAQQTELDVFGRLLRPPSGAANALESDT